MKIQVILYPCCGACFSACKEPFFNEDEDWQKEIKEYVKKGCIIKTVNHDEFSSIWNKECNCADNPVKQERLKQTI